MRLIKRDANEKIVHFLAAKMSYLLSSWKSHTFVTTINTKIKKEGAIQGYKIWIIKQETNKRRKYKGINTVYLNLVDI